MTRIKNMPFWILADEKQQTMWFDHVTPDLKKDELLRYIRSGLVYIRRADARAKETLVNCNL